jgi:hypothetical protein
VEYAHVRPNALTTWQAEFDVYKVLPATCLATGDYNHLPNSLPTTHPTANMQPKSLLALAALVSYSCAEIDIETMGDITKQFVDLKTLITASGDYSRSVS